MARKHNQSSGDPTSDERAASIESQFNDMVQEVDSRVKPKMAVRSLKDIQEEKIEWLWYERIARGELCIVAGEPGCGKTMILCDLAARISRGGAAPLTDECMTDGDAQVVVFLTSENDPATVLRPRLVAANADLENIFIIESVLEHDKRGLRAKRHVALDKDSETLGATLEDIKQRGKKVACIIIDPISEYLGEKDANNNAEIRSVLATLTDNIRNKDIAIIAVTHLNKKVDVWNASARISGSIGFAGAARTAFACTKYHDPEWNEDEKKAHKGEMAFVNVKNNLSGNKTGIIYRIETYEYNTERDLIKTARAQWLKGIEDSADDVMRNTAMSNRIENSKGSRNDEIEEALGTYLAKIEGGIKVNEVLEAFKGKCSRSTLYRAAQKMGADKERFGYWKLPEELRVWYEAK